MLFGGNVIGGLMSIITKPNSLLFIFGELKHAQIPLLEALLADGMEFR